nr:AMP-binding protein [Streptomyces sp. N2A]
MRMRMVLALHEAVPTPTCGPHRGLHGRILKNKRLLRIYHSAVRAPPHPSTSACSAVDVVQARAVEGQLALRSGWPSMFRGHLNDRQRYQAAFADDWYLTGDLARRDEDGWYARRDRGRRSRGAGSLTAPGPRRPAPPGRHGLGCTALRNEPNAPNGQPLRSRLVPRGARVLRARASAPPAVNSGRGGDTAV